jgi:adenylate cyclase
MDYFGPVVNLSARISDTAHGGQIVCSDEVRQAVSKAMVNGNPSEIADVEALVDDFRPVFTDHGAHMLKGIKEATPIFQIASNDLSARPFPPLRTGKK